MNIDVAAHISELLYESDEVLIPNLGTFSTITKSAEINKFQQLSPATKEVIFDKSKISGNNFLIQSIVNKYQIPSKTAQEIVNTFVQKTKSKLSNQAVSISNIGRLYTDVNKGITFVPSNTNFSNDAFGLPKLDFSPISRQTEKTAILPVEIVPLTEKRSLKTFFANIWKDASVRAILVIFVFIFIIFQINRLVNDESEIVVPSIIENKDNLIDSETNLNPYENTIEEAVEETPTIITETDQVEEQEISEEEKRINRKPESNSENEIKGVATEKPTPEKPESEIATATRKNYVIIIGNFSTQANADIAAAQVKKAGYVAYMKKINATKHRVGISLSSTKNDLDNTVGKIKAIFPDAWVMNR